MSIPTGGPRGSDEDEVGGSIGIVGALEQVGEGTSGSGDASTMGGDASGMGGWTSS